MPEKNVIKKYIPDSFYHIYNRGVEKRQIYLDKYDYNKFLDYLQGSLKKSYTTLSCYCLMPNHFHLLVKQEDARGIEKLMRSLLTKYSMYFNYKHNRVGTLFQSTYKARLIESEEDLINTSAYIHNNPSKDNPGIIPEKYPYSSFYLYVSGKEISWINVATIKNHFVVESYKKYVGRMGNSTDDLG